MLRAWRYRDKHFFQRKRLEFFLISRAFTFLFKLTLVGFHASIHINRLNAKPIDNIGNRDYLQVLAYMFRFDAKAGYYLYPEAEGSDDLKLWLNRGSTYEKNVMARDDISVTKHGLKIPVNALNYAEFSVRMKTCEQEFKSALIF